MTAQLHGRSIFESSRDRPRASGFPRIPWRLLPVPMALMLAQMAGSCPVMAQAISSSPGTGPTITQLHLFGPPDELGFPLPDLIQASNGNFYGAAGGVGGLYMITPDGSMNMIHYFGFFGNLSKGTSPVGPLVQGTDGKLYGVTAGGGPNNHGEIYKMNADIGDGGDRNEPITILHGFGDAGVADDGAEPETGLIQGADGNFYGTTNRGGANDTGTIYRMTPAGAVTILHSFDARTINFGDVYSYRLIQGIDGNFYGTASVGGPGIINTTQGDGLFFKMTPAGVFTVLHSFGGGSVPNDGASPSGRLVQLPGSTIYGITTSGGLTADNASGDGVAYKISPSGAYAVIHRFHDGSVAGEGANPVDGLIRASDGSFYGVTGEATNATAFKMTQAGVMTVLGSFVYGTNSLIEGWDGNLYGTTPDGPDVEFFDDGTFYRISTGLIPIAPPLTSPVNLTATPTTGIVTLNWTKTPKATVYDIYRGTFMDGEAATPYVSGVTTNTFVDTGLTNGVTYYYKVKARNTVYTSGYSFEAQATPEVPPPSAPANLTGTAAPKQVTLNWTASAGADSYSVYGAFSFMSEQLLASGLTSTSYISSGLADGQVYHFYVVAVNGGGPSPQSNEVTIQVPPYAPPAPSGLTATAGNTQVNLSWTAGAGATGYNIYRGTTSGGENTTVATNVAGTSYLNTGVRNQVRYYYRVTATNVGGESSPSNEVSALPLPAAPATPANLTATPGNKQVSLSWSPVSDATGYKVYRGTIPGGESTVAIYGANATTTTFVNTGLTNGVTYYYKVAAINPGGISPNSNEASATPAP